MHRPFVTAAPRQFLCRFQNARMFNGADENMSGFQAIGRTANKQVIGFRATTGKDYLYRLRADRIRHLLACLINRPPCVNAMRMPTGCIAEFLLEIRQHGIQYRIIHAGGGIVVEIDGGHQSGSKWCGIDLCILIFYR